jgi:hypothetical protein
MDARRTLTYPKVDRSDYTLNFDSEMGDAPTDIGWAEGVLQDGRPYRMECWGLAGSTGVTVFMPSEGIAAFDVAQVNALLEASRVITTLAPQELSLHHFSDPAGTPCVSISYIVANEDDDHIIQAHPLLTSYDTGGVILGRFDEQLFLAELDAILFVEPRTRSAMAEARRAAKALAKTQPKKKRPKRRKFRRS